MVEKRKTTMVNKEVNYSNWIPDKYINWLRIEPKVLKWNPYFLYFSYLFRWAIVRWILLSDKIKINAQPIPGTVYPLLSNEEKKMFGFLGGLMQNCYKHTDEEKCLKILFDSSYFWEK